MKILMQNRLDAFSAPGGDTVQMLKTKEYLERSGVQVDISLELSPDVSKYDIIHLFNITRMHETYMHYVNAKAQNKPVVVSSIYQNFEELDQRSNYGARSFILKRLPKDLRELAKTCVRAILDKRQVPAAIKQGIIGFTRQQKEVLSGAAAVLPNSKLEAEAIQKDFGLKIEYTIVPNAIDKIFCATEGEGNKTLRKEGVICIGNYIERKNQIALIKAMQGLQIPLVLVGSVVPTYIKYYRDILSLAKKADYPIKVIEKIPQNELVPYLTMAKVIALPSWIETTGLSCLEGACAGCNVVITDRGYTKEYFGEMAYYCDPSDIASIRNAVKRAYNSPVAPGLKERIINEYTWDKTADATLKAYRRVLK